jgi:hypothetical protein
MIKVKQPVYTIIHSLSNKFEHSVTLVVRGVRIYWHILILQLHVVVRRVLSR